MKIQLLKHPEHHCIIEVNPDGSFLNGERIDREFNFNILFQLCDEIEIQFSENPENAATKYHFYVNKYRGR